MAVPTQRCFDAFPNRVHKLFVVYPKATRAAPQLARELRAWAAKTYGETNARDCDAAISELCRLRDVVVRLGNLDCSGPSTDSLVAFQAHFEDVYAPQGLAYIRTLREFVGKLRGTAASRGMASLSLVWKHWLSDSVASEVDTDSLNFELYSAIWCMAAAYSINATILPPRLRTASQTTEDGSVLETPECSQHRTKNYMRSAMMFHLLEKTISRIGFVLDEFHPVVCRILTLVMLAQAQECAYYGLKMEHPGRDQRFEHAALAAAAIAYYKGAMELLETLPQCDVSVSSQSSPPSLQLPANLFARCYAAGAVLTVSKFSHMMDADKDNSLDWGRLMGNCARTLEFIARYLLNVGQLCLPDEVSMAPTFRALYSAYERLNGELLEKNKRFNEVTWTAEKLEDSDPRPVDCVSLESLTISQDSLRKTYLEESENRFHAILSLDSLLTWCDYRKKRAIQYGLQCAEMSDYRARVRATLESPTAIFPLLYLYFAAHSLGISGASKAPAQTPLGKKASSVLQGAAAWADFEVLCGTIRANADGALQMVGELGRLSSELRSFISRLDSAEAANFALDMPTQRCGVLIEEYKAYHAPLIKPEVYEAARRLRRSEPFAAELSLAVAMPAGFWDQINNPRVRAPATETPIAAVAPAASQAPGAPPPPLQPSPAPSEGDLLIEEMDHVAISERKERAAKALNLQEQPAPPSSSSAFWVGIFASATGNQQQQQPRMPAQRQHPQPPPPTPFSSANPNLRVVKMMTRIVKLLDDIHLPLEELQDELCKKISADMAAQNTEIPPTESSHDHITNKLAWLRGFSQNSHDLMETGKQLMAELSKIDPGKDAMIEELRNNFGYSSAGGPIEGSTCTILDVVLSVCSHMRAYALATRAYAIIRSEGALVRAQCNDITSYKATPRGVALSRRLGSAAQARSATNQQLLTQQSFDQPAPPREVVAMPTRTRQQQHQYQNGGLSHRAPSSAGARDKSPML